MSADIYERVSNEQFLPRAVNELTCLEFKIIQQNPIQVEFIKLTDLSLCHEIAGYQPQEQVILFNWIDDVYKKFAPKSENEENIY